MNSIHAWAARNRPAVAAIAAALVPLVTALLVGDVQALLDAWPAFVQVTAPIGVSVLIAYAFGVIAQGGSDDPIIGQPLARRATEKQIGTVPMSELLDDGPSDPDEAAALFGEFIEGEGENMVFPPDDDVDAFIAANADTLGSLEIELRKDEYTEIRRPREF